MRLFGYPYNDLVICKDSPDYLPIIYKLHNNKIAELKIIDSIAVACSYMLIR